MDVRFISGLAFTGLGLLSVAASAAEVNNRHMSQQPVTVVANEAEPLKIEVPYGDLALSTIQGREALTHRVRQAVNDLCPIFDEEGRVYDAQDCRDFAWRGARPQIKEAINLAKFGSQVAMAIEVAAPESR